MKDDTNLGLSLFRNLGILLMLIPLASACMVVTTQSGVVAADDNDLNVNAPPLGGSNATLTTPGEFDAVVNIGNCTGTLISKEAVLTAGHCVCGTSGTFPASGCDLRKTVTFTNVLPVGSTVRRNVAVGADVIVHPNFNNGGWLVNDYAVLRLDTPADQLVQVTPIRVASTVPSVGETHTLVGYGEAGAACDLSFGTKLKGSTVLDSVVSYADWISGKTLTYNDTTVHGCYGDSGGPAINASGQVVGVASSSNLKSNSNYDATSAAWLWLQAHACPRFDATHPDTGFCSDPMCPCASGAGDCDSNAQCKAGNTCVNNIGTAAGLPKDYDVCWHSYQLVTVYEHASHTGTAQNLPTGTWDFETLGIIGNDRISSLTATPGLTIHLYAEAGCWGDTLAYSGNVPNVGALLDNQTSCVKINPGVTLYANFVSQQTFEVGGYNHLALTGVENDQADFLVALPGITVRLCSESGAPGTVGWGTCQEYSGAVGNLGALAKNASNVEVFAGATAYRDPDYSGVSQTFKQGNFGSSALTVVGNNQISSLIVAPGMQARVCSGNGGGGDCQTFTGWVPFVGKTLNDRISNIEIGPIQTASEFPGSAPFSVKADEGELWNNFCQI